MTTTAPFVVGSDTSEDAAYSIEPALDRLEDEVFWEIRRNPHGRTCEQIENALGGSHQTISPRIVKLREKGKVKDSGKRRTNRSGRKATVWVEDTTGGAQTVSAAKRNLTREEMQAAIRAVAEARHKFDKDDPHRAALDRLWIWLNAGAPKRRKGDS